MTSIIKAFRKITYRWYLHDTVRTTNAIAHRYGTTVQVLGQVQRTMATNRRMLLNLKSRLLDDLDPQHHDRLIRFLIRKETSP